MKKTAQTKSVLSKSSPISGRVKTTVPRPLIKQNKKRGTHRHRKSRVKPRKGLLPPSEPNLKLVQKFLKRGVGSEVLQRRSKLQIWRHCDSGFDRRANVKRLNRNDINVAKAWTMGIVKFNLPKEGLIPNGLKYSVRKIGSNTYVMKHKRNLNSSQELIRFLHHAKAKVFNIFGSLQDSTRTGDPVLSSLSICISLGDTLGGRVRNSGQNPKMLVPDQGTML